MKKILLWLLVSLLVSTSCLASYQTNDLSNFVNSVNTSEINSIEDKNLAYCEEIFLKAYMRREFTEDENLKCSDIFEVKIEAQLNYMNYVMWNRGIY